MAALRSGGGQGAVDIKGSFGMEQDMQDIPARSVQKKAVSLQDLLDGGVGGVRL